MTLEEIKTAIVERIGAAWTEVKDEVDPDKVRTYVQGLTAELLGHVYAIEAELVNHVLGKQDTPAPSPDASPTPVADVPVAPVMEVSPAAATEPAESAPADVPDAAPGGVDEPAQAAQ